MRWAFSRLLYFLGKFIAKVIASLAYLPLARLAKLFIRLGKDVPNFPLHHYAGKSFVMLQNDALDRFSARLEPRFSKVDITEMLKSAEFDISTLKFSEVEPFWTFSIEKAERRPKRAGDQRMESSFFGKYGSWPNLPPVLTDKSLITVRLMPQKSPE